MSVIDSLPVKFTSAADARLKNRGGQHLPTLWLSGHFTEGGAESGQRQPEQQ